MTKTRQAHVDRLFASLKPLPAKHVTQYLEYIDAQVNGAIDLAQGHSQITWSLETKTPKGTSMAVPKTASHSTQSEIAVRALCHLPATFEEVVDTLITDTTASFQAFERAAHPEDFIDGRVVHVLRPRTAASPNAFACIKWYAQAPGGHLSSSYPTVSERDYLYLEVVGETTDVAGETLGYRLGKSVVLSDIGNLEKSCDWIRGKVNSLVVFRTAPEGVKLTVMALDQLKGSPPLSSLQMKKITEAAAGRGDALRTYLNSRRLTLLKYTLPSKWSSVKKCPSCAICTKAFSSLLRKPHNCRACGDVICSHCSFHHSVQSPSKSPSKSTVKKERPKIRLCQRCNVKSRHLALPNAFRASLMHVRPPLRQAPPPVPQSQSYEAANESKERGSSSSTLNLSSLTRDSPPHVLHHSSPSMIGPPTDESMREALETISRLHESMIASSSPDSHVMEELVRLSTSTRGSAVSSQSPLLDLGFGKKSSDSPRTPPSTVSPKMTLSSDAPRLEHALHALKAHSPNLEDHPVPYNANEAEEYGSDSSYEEVEVDDDGNSIHSEEEEEDDVEGSDGSYEEVVVDEDGNRVETMDAMRGHASEDEYEEVVVDEDGNIIEDAVVEEVMSQQSPHESTSKASANGLLAMMDKIDSDLSKFEFSQPPPSLPTPVRILGPLRHSPPPSTTNDDNAKATATPSPTPTRRPLGPTPSCSYILDDVASNEMLDSSESAIVSDDDELRPSYSRESYVFTTRTGGPSYVENFDTRSASSSITLDDPLVESEGLPDNWKAVYSAPTGRMYYYNEELSRTQWTRPGEEKETEEMDYALL